MTFRQLPRPIEVGTCNYPVTFRELKVMCILDTHWLTLSIFKTYPVQSEKVYTLNMLINKKIYKE